jgi:hypothetical protein
MADRPLLSAHWLIGVLVAVSEPLAAPVTPSTTPAATWLEVSERTACEAMQEEYCVGRYGFTIHHDETFVAGGFGSGRTIEGKIASQELQQLSLLIREASRGALGAEQMCSKGGLPGIKDQVDLTFKDGTVVRIYDLGGRVGQVCYVGNWDKVRRLHGYLRSLMSRYYPVPFPRS